MILHHKLKKQKLQSSLILSLSALERVNNKAEKRAKKTIKWGEEARNRVSRAKIFGMREKTTILAETSKRRECLAFELSSAKSSAFRIRLRDFVFAIFHIYAGFRVK